MIEDKPKSWACAVFHDDEGFDWSQICPEEDRLDYRFKIRTMEDLETPLKKPDHYAFVAEIKDDNKDTNTAENKEENVVVEMKKKTREEILSEKTYRERNVVYNRMDDMQEEYESAVSNRRWDKKRESVTTTEKENQLFQRKT